jgi:retron-type reverse transcriptase
MVGTPSPQTISTKQLELATRAERYPREALSTLAHFIDLDWLREAYRRTRKDGAPGVDGQVAAEYEADLEQNLSSLLDRFKSGHYRAPPVKRVYIPKGDGKRLRPIGMPTLEDKVLQRAVVMVLEPLYEQQFLDCSYGFRPGRSAHQALDQLWQRLMPLSECWLIELDIESFFDRVDRARLREMVARRVGDGVIRRVIGKWLQAGVLEGTQLSYPEQGTPQGGVISPLLANIYLHEVLDRWFEQDVKPRLKGRSFMVRYADDCAPRRRGGEFYVVALNALKQPCCTRDEGGPLEPGLQDLGSNHRMLLRSNGRGGERDGKGRARPCQVSVEKTSESKPPMNCRKRRNDVKTRGQSLFWDQFGRNLFTAQTTSGGRGGVSSMQALVWNVGTCALMRRKQLKRTTRESLSTDAGHRGGVARGSEEGSVMVATRTRPRGSGCSVPLWRWEKVSRGLLAEAGLKPPRCCCTQKVWW